MIGAEDIRQLIPHEGGMSLLSHVLSFDDATIICDSTTHLNSDNPLRTKTGLPAVTGIEYGAQAMAVHGALTGHSAETSYLVTARDVEMRIERLDEVQAALHVSAKQLMRSPDAAMYQFSISAEERVLVAGRLMVAFAVET
jgi:predicted hotdog family 3-hydroxylacyl-ACP dehydratase